MSTQTADFHGRKKEKTSLKAMLKMSQAAILVTSFFQMDKNKTKKLCKQDTKGALSLFEGF